MSPTANAPAPGEPDPRLCEGLIARGEQSLRRRETDPTRLEAAVRWLLERVRVELREGQP